MTIPKHFIPNSKANIYIILITCACLLLTISKILSFGFTPSDDVLRHAAVAYSGVDYVDIILTNLDIHVMDSTPVFHRLLKGIQNIFHFEKLTLVGLLIFSLFTIATLPAVFTFDKHPEVWLLTLTFYFMSGDFGIGRLCLGRPYLITFGAIILILKFYDKIKDPNAHISKWHYWIGAITLFDVALHGTWYLYGLLIAAFFILEQNRKTFSVSITLLIGIALGLLCTGHPIDYLIYQFQHAYLAGKIPLEARVTEFWPFRGNALMTSSLILLFILGLHKDFAWIQKTFKSPAFVLFALCWILGLTNRRFYIDIGVPALLVWISLIAEQILMRINLNTLKRLALSLLLAFIFYTSQSVNVGERWEQTTLNKTLPFTKEPETYAEWLPEPGGILYNTDMITFYSLFFTFPDAPWRYAQGLEKAIMPPEDLQVILDLADKKNWDPLKTWVDKMTPADRIFLNYFPDEKKIPDYPQLEFINIEKSFCIARLKQEESPEE